MVVLRCSPRDVDFILVYILEYDVPFSRDIFKALFFCLSLFFCVFFRDKEFVKKSSFLS